MEDLPNGLVRGGVALKSTTLNGRNPLTVNKPVNTEPSPSKSVLTHPAPLPPAAVGPIGFPVVESARNYFAITPGVSPFDPNHKRTAIFSGIFFLLQPFF